MIQLKRNPTERILELGGGDAPVVHPRCLGGEDCNCDVRFCQNAQGQQTVDFTANFEEPFPISSDEWDGVLSKFCLEHISHQKVPQFISEIYRVLKPGGRVILITPNTEAQLKWILDHPDGWDRWGPFGDCSVLLYGQQDYNDNSHKSFFSPKFMEKLLKDAGFIDIHIEPFGENQTDMVTVAEKLINPRTKMDEHIKEMESKDISRLEEKRDGIERYRNERQGREERRGEDTDILKFPVATEVQTPMSIQEGSKTAQAPSNIEQQIQEAEQQTVQVKEFGGNIVVSPQEVEKNLIFAPIPAAPHWMPESPNHAGLSVEERAKLFGRDYFDGGRKYGGYASPGYRDFPVNEVIARKVLEKKPQSVLELGMGRGYVLKRIQDAGVKAEGIDISKHCYMTRVCEGFLLGILGEFPRKYAGVIPPPLDFCYSQDYWQYVPEEMVEETIKEMARASKRGLHGINFGDSYDNFDKLVCNLKSRDWWLERMPAGHEVKSSAELASGAFPQDVLKGDGKTKLAIGGFTTMFHHGWTNIGEADLGASFAQPNGYNYMRWDCRNGIPCQTKSVDLIFLPHYLQRLNYTEGLAFLRDCRRVLKPEGAMRVLVPNASWIMNEDEDWFKELENISPSIEAASTLKQKQWEMLGNGQQSTYDAETLETQLADAGFESNIVKFREAYNGEPAKQICRETMDVGVSYALIAEALPKVG